MQGLTARWQRHDWQSSPFAPGLRWVQAKVQNGRTASGAGLSRYDAYMRCLGETAEIVALEADTTEIVGSEGLAAGPDTAFASYAALCERLERWAVKEWWSGNSVALPVRGYAHLLTPLRNGASAPRETRLWLLPHFPLLGVVLCRSTDPQGGQPILGFGADLCAEAAAQSAIIEMALMEANIAKKTTRMRAYYKRLTTATTSLFPNGKPQDITATRYPESQKLPTLTARLNAANIHFSVQALTTPQTGLAVCRAHIPGAPGFTLSGSPENSPLL